MNFSHILIEWYAINKRDLPWRHTSDPYRIWVSEVILQQTRVNQGISYYLRFIEKFPTVVELAHADIDSVLKIWQGLGYYTRARNMHKTALEITSKLQGRFPSTYKELILLRGIGDYTASAVAAFAFNEPVAAVDGNVYRIFARLFGVETPIDTAKGKKELKQIANEMLDKARPALYNQAIMDFGGTLCTPKKPRCLECPVIDICSAYRNRKVDVIPVKATKVKQSTRFFTYVVLVDKGYTYIAKRLQHDIWHSLYEFPLIETADYVSLDQLIEYPAWKNMFGKFCVSIDYVSEVKKYMLSHQRIFAQFIVVSIDGVSGSFLDSFSRIKAENIHEYSIPKLIEGFIAAEPVEKYFKKKD